MKCPVCQKEMKLFNEDISYRDDGKKYNRSYYNCEKDDTWMIMEIPKESNLA